MLRIDNLFENFELARECLAGWNYDEESLMDCFSHYRISSNAVYPFRQNGRLCFLRMAPVDEKDFYQVNDEIEILNWLMDQEFEAMEPMLREDGEYIVLEPTEWGTYIVTCFYAVEGQSLEDTEFEIGTDEGREELLSVAEEYGKSLGELHNTLTQYPKKHERKTYEDLLNTAEKRLVDHRAPEYMLEELHDVREELSRLPTDSGVYGLVHYDYEPDNVFYDRKTGKISAIDFDEMINCHFALDIVRAIDSMGEMVGEGKGISDEERNRLIKEACQSFMSGYRMKKNLSLEQELSFNLMRRLVRITEYAGLLYTLAPEVNEEPEWMTELRFKLSSFCNRIEEAIR